MQDTDLDKVDKGRLLIAVYLQQLLLKIKRKKLNRNKIIETTVRESGEKY